MTNSPTTATPTSSPTTLWSTNQLDAGVIIITYGILALFLLNICFCWKRIGANREARNLGKELLKQEIETILTKVKSSS